VHASAYPGLMYLGGVAARRSGARLVLMPCSHLGLVQEQAAPPRLDRRLVHLYRQADALVALTQLEKELLVSAGIPPEQITVTGAGVHPASASEANGEAFRHKFGLAADRSILAFVGHKTPDKGAIHFLEAACEIAACRADVTFVMVGARTQAFAEFYRSLPAAVQERVLDVYLEEAEKHNLLAASTALVLPSSVDGFGIVLLEAWLHGKPVIGALAGGISAVVEHERTGLLVPYGDVEALVKTMCWLLDHPDRAAEMGEAGRRHTLDQWTWDRVYERLRPIYERLLAPR
jgi:glycosyltransferase involved in cell wall biosynthesis